MNKLENKDILNNERFAKLYIDSFINSNKLYGTLYLKNKLRNKGLSLDLIDNLLNEFKKVLDDISFKKIYLYLKKHSSNESLFVFKKNHYSKLLKRGFYAQELNESLNEFFSFK